MVLDCTVSNYWDPTFLVRWRRGGDALVELAAASAARMAHRGLLAGIGDAGAVPDFVRRNRRSQRTSRPPRMERSLQTDDARRASEISPSDAAGIRIRSVRRPGCSPLSPAIAIRGRGTCVPF